MTQAAAHMKIAVPPRDCRHEKHHGACPCCQRHQKARWSAQLDQVAPVRSSNSLGLVAIPA